MAFQKVFRLTFLAAAWISPSTRAAPVRGTVAKKSVAQEVLGEQNQRRLYGERIGRGDRGGEGGRNKGFQEFQSMMSRVPLGTLAPSASGPTSTPPTGTPGPTPTPPPGTSIGGGTVSSITASTVPVSESATYDVVFTNNWSGTNHPPDYPSNAHWSPPYLAAHSSAYTMWQEGAMASAGVQRIAETGNILTLRDELSTAGSAVGDQTIGDSQFNNEQQSQNLTITVSLGQPHLSAMTMVAPSPDWFAGFNAYAPNDGSVWHESFTIYSQPYDAGTDSGTTYTSANSATDPQENIFEITAATSPPSSQVFVKDGGVLPVLKWTFTRAPNGVSDPAPVPTKVPTAAPVPDPTPPPTEVPSAAPVPDPTPPPTEAPTAAPVPDPTPPPTEAPTAAPVPDPTPPPTEAPTAATVPDPTPPPTDAPTAAPVPDPTPPPTDAPTAAPVPDPTPPPTTAPTAVPPTDPPTDPPPAESTFVMGRLNKVENGLTLSEGLSSTIIARSNVEVLYDSGEQSNATFHNRPSAGDTFVDTQGGNPGGWIYLSGKDAAQGGMGAITFNAAGKVINYEMILEGTTSNSNGGRTPWDTWVSGERLLATLNGDAIQVDPFGVRDAEVITMTEDGGAWEGFTYDIRDPEAPYFFMSEDFVFGAVRRFTPAVVNRTDPWVMLQGPGTTDYLVLQPDPNDDTVGEFSWINQVQIARGNAARNYPESNGIDINGSTLAFVLQGSKQLFLLDLDSGEYKKTPTSKGLLEGEPQEIRYVTDNNDQTLLYITEGNGQRSGVHARTDAGLLYTVFEGQGYQPLTSGFALSPDGMHMYTSFKRDGVVFDITRDDGLSFFDPALAYEVTP